MRVIIAGSRHMPFSSFHLIPEAVKRSNFNVTEVVCGMAAGADMLGGKWATQRGISVTCFYPDWNTHGKAAGPIRNQEMAEYADALIVFIWEGSRGSKDMLIRMQRMKKPTFAVYDGNIDYAF